MRRVILSKYLVIVVVMFGLSISVFASDNDLNQRLLQEASAYKYKIETFRRQQFEDTANLLTGSGLSDPELYKVVETRAQLIFQDHLANPDNYLIGDELSAIVRTMASMSPASAPFINKVIYSGKSHSVRNRAKSSSEKIYWFAQRNRIMQNSESYVPDQDLMTYRFINLFNNEEPSFGRWALEEIQRRGGAERVVYQVMGQKLLAKKDNITSVVELDYLAWICKILAKYDAQNSHEVLDTILHDSRHGKKFTKLKKEANYTL